ncbi:hypothetical protein GSH19_05090 [Lactobacillus sp. S2-2]|uniref:hypothetical protein n=1 Tax=Lactobacillus sp. S2-2 TaxID=2692917 RepID=UPI001F25A85B|nr:hypothetical protein [Lactobacillus sp. S2-2]MCF6515527.1 hypothetical protein [Lactobacillus sp. S2-2]
MKIVNLSDNETKFIKSIIENYVYEYGPDVLKDDNDQYYDVINGKTVYDSVDIDNQKSIDSILDKIS